MPFSTALFITPIALNFPAKACANTRSCRPQTQLPLDRKRLRRQISEKTQRRSKLSGFASESRPVLYRNRRPVAFRNHCPVALEYAVKVGSAGRAARAGWNEQVADGREDTYEPLQVPG